MTPVAYDNVNESTSTSCTFSEDFSNYWAANLFFQVRNGSLKRVPQMANQGLTVNGGLTVYYIPPYDGRSTVTAFELGFRMLVGDLNLRPAASQQRQLCHRCFSTINQVPFGGAPYTSSDTGSPPTGCWDGKNLDSADHKSHVAYPSSGTFESTGPCPSTHPVTLPQLMYEVTWDTREFNTKYLWLTDSTKQPFVYSTGDGTGYGQHGDYIFGWKGDSLQRALNARCSNDKCSQPTSQSSDTAEQCFKSQAVQEETEGWLSELPGNLPITYS